jgi:hypothetical protein
MAHVLCRPKKTGYKKLYFVSEYSVNMNTNLLIRVFLLGTFFPLTWPHIAVNETRNGLRKMVEWLVSYTKQMILTGSLSQIIRQVADGQIHILTSLSLAMQMAEFPFSNH